MDLQQFGHGLGRSQISKLGVVVNDAPNPSSLFPYKLHKMLTDAAVEGFESIVSWLEEPIRVTQTQRCGTDGDDDDGEEEEAHSYRQAISSRLLAFAEHCHLQHFSKEQTKQSPAALGEAYFRQGFRVHKPHLFVQNIMPRYFPRSTKYRSFQRQLNLWCYQRVENGPHKDSYHHPFFVKDDRSLCRHMIRTKTKNNNTGILIGGGGIIHQELNKSTCRMRMNRKPTSGPHVASLCDSPASAHVAASFPSPPMRDLFPEAKLPAAPSTLKGEFNRVVSSESVATSTISSYIQGRAVNMSFNNKKKEEGRCNSFSWTPIKKDIIIPLSPLSCSVACDLSSGREILLRQEPLGDWNPNYFHVNSTCNKEAARAPHPSPFATATMQNLCEDERGNVENIKTLFREKDTPLHPFASATKRRILEEEHEEYGEKMVTLFETKQDYDDPGDSMSPCWQQGEAQQHQQGFEPETAITRCVSDQVVGSKGAEVDWFEGNRFYHPLE